MSRLVKRVCLFITIAMLIMGSLSFFGVKTKADTVGADKITIGVIKNTSAIPLIMAKQSHDYTRNNINVEVKIFDSNKELNDAINQGTVNMAVSNLVSYASISNKNSEWKIAGTMPGYYGLVANKKYKNIKNLKGKTIAIDKADMSKAYLSGLLKKNKIKISSVKLSQFDSESDRVNAIKEGKVDAAILEDTSLSEAKANGNKCLNKEKTNKDNGNILIISNKFAKKNASSTRTLVDVINGQIKTINEAGTYVIANNAFRELQVSDKAVGKLNNVDVKFIKMHKVKKTCFNRYFKYAKHQKIYNGKFSYNQSNIKIKNVK